MLESAAVPSHVTVSESIVVRAAPEVVWDFTQDFARRASWDATVLEARVLSETPVRRVRIRGVGGLTCVLEYKLFERPRRTSLAMVEVEGSKLVAGGGGSWSYEPTSAGTLWTQTNTLAIADGPFAWLVRPLARMQLRRATREAMAIAARKIEGLQARAPSRS